jgi:hypothetical protein
MAAFISKKSNISEQLEAPDRTLGLIRAVSDSQKVFGVNPLYFAINQHSKPDKNETCDWKTESLKDLNEIILDEVAKEIKHKLSENKELVLQAVKNAINKNESDDYDNPELPVAITKTGKNGGIITSNFQFNENILHITLRVSDKINPNRADYPSYKNNNVIDVNKFVSIKINPDDLKKMVLDCVKSRKDYITKVLSLKDEETVVLENNCRFRPFLPVVTAKKKGKSIKIFFNKTNFKMNLELFVKK